MDPEPLEGEERAAYEETLEVEDIDIVSRLVYNIINVNIRCSCGHVSSFSPPSSDGSHVIQILTVLGHFDLKDMGSTPLIAPTSLPRL